MRRKSERNKTKGSPEKKVEKPTRKSTRRRGKRSPSTSSEQDPFIEDVAKNAIQLKEIEKETSVQTRLQSKELEQVPHKCEEKVSSTDVDVKVDSPEDEEDNGGSVWKVARADASPGEIQKLKLCRQRNTSEPSDTPPSNRKSVVKSSSKWQESGEGVAEEADSADEQLVSCTRTLSSTEQPNDPSSSYPGQDSNEEVSDSKEILPETTSANLLSDDKPNIDQHGESNEANCTAQIVDIEPGKPGSMTPSPVPAPSANGEETVTAIIVKEDKPAEDISEKPTETFVKETNVEIVHRDMNSEDEEEEKEEEEEEKEEKEKDKAKMHRPVDSSSDSNDESRSKRSRTSSDRTSPRATRRKHRNKYRDSSNSDTPDSEDEPIDRKISESYVVEEEEEQERKPSTEYLQENDKQRSVSPERTNSHSNNVEKIELEHSETVENKLEKNITEKLEQSTPANTQVVAHKPVKVNLKRSFSTRILSEKNEMKRDDADASVESSSQNKENGNEQEPKCVPRKRRWGTALSTDTTPSFSISTDSLKALVPGAKPLSINEVRLSKDDDEDRDRHRSNDKRHNSNDITYDKTTDENLQKNGAAKKGNGKVDNHIVTRRKISIVKEMPHIKSPSPPTSKPTNILLIKNLVRPFTLNQIKELLSRTGTIVENGFWMDRIKSKCIVEYSNEDQAFETRQALHGISWPMSNPKKLHVEYATKEDMETARESSKEQPVARKTEPLSSDSWQQDWTRDEKTNTKVTVVREWDLGKEDGQQHIREKEREKKEHDKKRRVRSRSPILDAHLSAPARKFKKKEDDPPPAKLLDDLFRKTKATPCIYWLPLTNEQIVVKEEMRRQHMAEHARRLEEMRRADRNRDGRRRRSPRK